MGEHAVWEKHSLFEESLHSPLIIYYPGMKHEGYKTNAIVETRDIFPTLCDLTGFKIPEFVQGISLKDILEFPDAEGHSAVAYINNASTIRTATHRMTLHKDGFIELYDHTTEEKETKNVVHKYPKLVEELKNALKVKFQQ